MKHKVYARGYIKLCIVLFIRRYCILISSREIIRRTSEVKLTDEHSEEIGHILRSFWMNKDKGGEWKSV